MKRNTAPTKRIHLKEKTISWKDNELSLVDGKILVKNIFGDDFLLEFKDLAGVMLYLTQNGLMDSSKHSQDEITFALNTLSSLC